MFVGCTPLFIGATRVFREDCRLLVCAAVTHALAERIACDYYPCAGGS